MACISCDEFAKRITNLYKDEELKAKFENITGCVIFNNLFLCEKCEIILVSAFKFKEKCTENYERDLIKYDPHDKSTSSRHKPETSTVLFLAQEEDGNQVFSIETTSVDGEEEEEHLLEEEDDDNDSDEEDNDPLYQSTTSRSPDGRKRTRTRLRYTLTQKLEAIELADRSSNRAAAKKLAIDESCIRKWKQQKDLLILSKNQEASNRVTKRKSYEPHSETVDETEESFVAVKCEIPATDETVAGDESRHSIEIPIVKQLRTRRAYSSGEKLEVCAYAELTGNRAAAKVFKIDESCIRKWRNQKDLLVEINRERGTKRKPNLRFPQVEARLKSFVNKKLDEGVLLKPNEIKSESIRIAKELNISHFKGTSSYIFKFMERYHIPSGRGKSKTRKSPRNNPNER